MAGLSTGKGPETRRPDDEVGPASVSSPGTSRCRAYAAALRAAYRLTGIGVTGLLDLTRPPDSDPESVECYRLLLVLAHARGGPEGEAVAAVLRRGYVLVPGASALHRLPAGIYPITTPGIVWLGGGLPRHGSPWWAIVQGAQSIDVKALPQVHIVSAHASLCLRCELRGAGHDLG